MRRCRFWLTALLMAVTGVSAESQPLDFNPDDYRLPVAQWPQAETMEEAGKLPELAPLPELPAVPWDTGQARRLGQQLFFDPRLSGSGQIACASCHDPDLGWADGRRFAFGHDRQAGTRNSMTIVNAAYFPMLFWDGRADGLRDQALKPITNPVEMNADMDKVIDRLNAIPGYQKAFRSTFGAGQVTRERLATALAAFERRIVSRPNRLDRFIEGQYNALSDREIYGLHLFRTRAGCLNCHNGPLYSDGRFHHTGLSYYDRKYEDIGREGVTGRLADRGSFRTPSLRDLEYTGPWMHNGFFPSLRGILNMYNAGMIGSAELHPDLPPLSPLIRPLGLSEEDLTALEAFLRSLSRRPPVYRPPGLPK